MFNEYDVFSENNGITASARENFKRAIEQKHARSDFLIKEIFGTSKEGVELLQIWQSRLLLDPVAVDGMDMLEVGIKIGMKRFIIGIAQTIEGIKEND